VKDLRAFEDGFYPYLESAQASILTDIATKKALDDDIKGRLTTAIKEYKANFLADRADKDKAQKETVAAK
jgi:F-type H+-transporting ATPase subunit alpha